jgi:hypothetical protein
MPRRAGLVNARRFCRLLCRLLGAALSLALNLPKALLRPRPRPASVMRFSIAATRPRRRIRRLEADSDQKESS